MLALYFLSIFAKIEETSISPETNKNLPNSTARKNKTKWNGLHTHECQMKITSSLPTQIIISHLLHRILPFASSAAILYQSSIAGIDDIYPIYPIDQNQLLYLHVSLFCRLYYPTTSCATFAMPCSSTIRQSYLHEETAFDILLSGCSQINNLTTSKSHGCTVHTSPPLVL